MPKSLFTIRKKKKENHPKVIINADKTSFGAVDLTHAISDGKRSNLPLKNNPNPNDKRKAYVKKRIIRDFKFRFSKAFKNYQLSNDDIDELIKYFSKKKK